MPLTVAKDILPGRTVLITGAASGIGLATSRACLAAGAKVALLDMNPDSLKKAEAEIGGAAAFFFEGDISEEETFPRCFEAAEKALGPVDVLVNNAGILGPIAQLEEIDREGWRRTFDVNLFSAAMGTGEFVRRYRSRGGTAGVVINISSIAAMQPMVRLAPYCASKAALISFSRAAANELGPLGIRVIAICPAAVRGPRLERVVRDRAKKYGRTYEEEDALLSADSPLGKLVEFEDVANTAVFLASDAARLITGVEINVTGGRWR